MLVSVDYRFLVVPFVLFRSDAYLRAKLISADFRDLAKILLLPLLLLLLLLLLYYYYYCYHHHHHHHHYHYYYYYYYRTLIMRLACPETGQRYARTLANHYNPQNT